MPSPEEAEAYRWSEEERAVAELYRSMHVAGDPHEVREEIERRAAETNADEVMVFTSVYDPADRIRSYELLADVFGMANATAATR